MSLLSRIAIKKLPFEHSDWGSLVVGSITPDFFTPGLYGFKVHKSSKLSMRDFPFADGDECYIYNYSATSQPIKLIISDVDGVAGTFGGLTDGVDISSWGDKCIISKDFGSDVISANMDSQLTISCIDAASTYYDYDQSTSIMELGFSETFADGIYRLRFWDTATDKMVYMNARLTLNHSALGVNYYFVYDTNGELYLFNVATTVCLIQHIDTKYIVDVFSNNKKIGTFNYTPTRDFELNVNLRSYLESLFFDVDTSDIFNQGSVINFTEQILRSIKLNITYDNVNLNFSDYIYFTTSPIVNDTGYCTLEKYTTGTNMISPFSVMPYQSGFVVIALSIFYSDTVYYYYKLDGGVSSKNFVGKKGYNAYLLIKPLTTAEKPTKIELFKNVGMVLLKTIQIKQVGVYNGLGVILCWICNNGLTAFIMDCEYDEDITNEQVYTYNKVNVSNESKRKISLTAKNLTKTDKIGLATIIESQSLSVYSLSNNKFFPAKIETGTAKIRQSNEVSYSMDVVLEIDRNIKI